MQEIVFRVLGSAPEPYRVRIVRFSDKNLLAFCDCQAGEQGMHCKHRVGILMGDTSLLSDHNDSDLKTVQSWLPGTHVELAIVKMRTLEAEEARIKKELSAAKKQVAKSMLNEL